ncbi:MAG: hypothetical protein ABI680_17995 [Chthoniobacteraceae bacterium]
MAAWSEEFGLLERGLDTFYSKDLDLRGDRSTATFIAKALRAEGRDVTAFTVVRRKEPPGLGCTFVVSVDLPGPGVTSVEVLEKMPLVDSPELPPQGFALELAGIRILDPLSLTIGKIHAFNHRPAGIANEDAVHLHLLARIVPRFILEARERGLAAEVAERCRALDSILATWSTPFTPEILAAFRQALADSARG